MQCRPIRCASHQGSYHALADTIFVTQVTCVAGAHAAAPAAKARADAPMNCGNGCLKDKQRPVCGVDNVTYAHRCLAMCQGVSVQAQGACATEDADLLDMSGDLPSVTIEVMTRFRGRGFKCVQVRKHRCAGLPLWQFLWHGVDVM
jgi:hypothetical protein